MADKTFTQDQLNAIVAKETGVLKRSIADLERVKGELTASAQALTTERDTARGELTALQQKHTAALERTRQSTIAAQITTALTAARVIPEAVASAAHEFMRSVELEIDDEHVITGATYAGKQLSADDAAKAFLADRSWYAQATGMGGAGTRAATGRPHRRDPHEDASASELMREGWNR